MDIQLLDLERLTSTDESAASTAFDRLAEASRPTLDAYLRKYVFDGEQRQEFVQEALTKLWVHRSTFTATTAGAFLAFVSRIAHNVWVDWVRRNRIQETSEGEAPEPIDERDNALAEAFLQSDRSEICQAADELWLELSGTDAERAQKRLAAQLFYVDGASWEEVAALLGSGKPLNEARINSWVTGRTTLMDLAYTEFNWPYERLVETLFSLKSRLEVDGLADRANREQGEPPEGWSWPEVRAAILHYRNGLLDDQIVRFQGLSRAVLDSALTKAQQRLPISARARRLRDNLCLRHHDRETRETGVWRRLVFQYAYLGDLPHKQILERAVPAAQEVDFTLNLGMLGGWLSNGRLMGQLALHIQRRQS